MDKLIHTALNSMHAARLKQVTSAQNLSNAQVAGYRSDQIGGRFGSVYLSAENQLETRVFSKKSEPGLFSDKQGEMRLTGEQTDLAIEGDGYFIIENQSGDLGMTRRGDFTIGKDRTLINLAGERVLDTSLMPVTVPPFREIFISENGQLFIQPIGAEAGVQELVSQIAASSGEGLSLKKDIDGTVRPDGGFVREEFNADQNVRLKQGFLETSNVSVFDELVNNVDIQKQYQLNVKLISLAKQLDEAGASLLKLPNG
jgi:flagellar basal-body rod protein FlgF